MQIIFSENFGEIQYKSGLIPQKKEIAINQDEPEMFVF